jgi:hypothetical protein
VLLVGELETTTGTQKHFPFECRISNNHFHDLGLYGKQTAAVYISRAKRITVGHNLMHDLPQAGICIGDGTWGGHVIEYNHIHDTCLETQDHGPFNAWGSHRTIYNNIWVNCASSPCFHVGNEDNHDRYYNNITVMSPSFQRDNHDRLFTMKATGNEIYYLVFPPVRTSWLEAIDNNCFFNDLGRFIMRVMECESTVRRDIELSEWQAMGFDRNFEMGVWGLTREFTDCW